MKKTFNMMCICIAFLFLTGCGGKIDDFNKRLGDIEKTFAVVGRDLADSIPGAYFTRKLKEAHGPDGPKKTAALKEIRSLFGLKEEEFPEAKFEATARVHNVSHELDIDFLWGIRPFPEQMQSNILSVVYRPSVILPQKPRLEREQILQQWEKDSLAAAQNVANSLNYLFERAFWEARSEEEKRSTTAKTLRAACKKTGDGKIGNCEAGLVLANLEKRVLAAMKISTGLGNTVIPLPKNSYSEPWGIQHTKPIVFVVIPKEDIDKNPKMTMEITLHVEGDTSKKIGQENWYRVPSSRFCENTIDSDTYGTLCYFPQNLLGINVVEKLNLTKYAEAMSVLKALDEKYNHKIPQ